MNVLEYKPADDHDSGSVWMCPYHWTLAQCQSLSLCTAYSALCTVHCVQCTVHSVLCTVHCVQCTLYTVYSVQFTVYSTLCAVHYVQFTVYCTQCTAMPDCMFSGSPSDSSVASVDTWGGVIEILGVERMGGRDYL